jgi:hypothetical protein
MAAALCHPVRGERVNKRTVAVAVGLATLLVALPAVPAFAHGEKKVAKYTFVVGFGTEPAYAGASNSVQLVVSNNGKPVTDIKDGLKVAVTTGDAEAKQMALEPYFGQGWGEQGDYRAFFIPTTPGPYTFHITGAIKGKKIDQRFTSVKDGFDEVGDPAEVQYPAVEPTGSQLATRLDRETARLNIALAAERDQARDDAAAARGLATVGLVAGVLGLVGAVAAGGLLLRRRS